MMRKRKTGIILILCVCFLLLSCEKQEDLTIEELKTSQESETEAEPAGIQEESEEKVKSEEKSEEETIWVDVSGAVKNPGVYELKMDARVFEAVDAAGGFTEEADDTCINRAAVLRDGEKIRVYTAEEIQQMKSDGQMPEAGFEVQTDTGAGEKKVNLNTASAEELQQIPGIGAVRAHAIIDYREKSGLFKSAEDVQNVPGIKGKTFEKIEEYITVK